MTELLVPLPDLISAPEIAKWLFQNKKLEDFVAKFDRYVQKCEIYHFEEKIVTWKLLGHYEFVWFIKTFLEELIFKLNNETSKIPQTEREIPASHCISHISKIFASVLFKSEVAKALPDSLRKVVTFDTSPLIPIADNKVVDLTTGHVYSRSREHYFTFFCDVRHNPQADSTEIMKYLDQLFAEDLDYLRKVLQSMLSCESKIQGLWIHGVGSTGKSTFARFLENVFNRLCTRNFEVRQIHHQWRIIVRDECSPLTDPKFRQIVISQQVPEKRPKGFLVSEFKAVYTPVPHKLNEFLIDEFFFEKITSDQNKSAFMNWLLQN